jgi:Domain of unknown function (DUF4180)
MPNVIVAADHNLRIDAMSDIQLLLEAAFSADADGVLLTQSDLAIEFFDLRSGLAGELFQKCTNYRLRLALVVAQPATHGERFNELAREHARHTRIRFFAIESEALEWLEAD